MFIQDIFNKIINNDIKGIPQQAEPQAYSGTYSLWDYFSGEKDYFAMSNGGEYNVDYYTMATHAYNLYQTNEFVKAGVDRVVQFLVSTGLELYPMPKEDFLFRKYGIKLKDTFKNDIKDLWELYCTEKDVSVDKQDNIHRLAKIVAFNSVIGGDMLIIRRIVNGYNEYQLIDGRNVYSTKTLNSENGNKIKNGVEIDKFGRHVAYYILDDDGKEQRIQAFDDAGNLYAWLAYWNKMRIGSTRGYSILGAIMQKMDKIGEYSENEVLASALNGKFVATIEQDATSTGINPLNNKTLGGASRVLPESSSEKFEDKSLINKLYTQLRRFTNGLVLHMPRGQKLQAYDTKRPNTNYGAFLDTNMKYDYASMGVPAEAALMTFQNNFSSSRAALKMFEAVLKFSRSDSIVPYFYKIIYEQFFDLEVLKGNIEAPRYLELRNIPGYADNAYLLAKFEGMPIPHVDPVKEVNAVVTKLNNRLIDFEGALQELGNKTNFETLCKVYSEQIKKLDTAGIGLPSINDAQNYDEDDENEDKKDDK